MKLLLPLLAAALPSLPQEEAAQRPREFWKAVVESGYEVPAGEDAFDLICELSEHLGSTDSELRDDFAYGIPAAWIYRRRLLDETQLHALLRLWSKNLEHGLGEEEGDGVLLRSFSALNLSLLAAYDNQHPFLDEDRFADLLGTALAYMELERDLRGWTEEAGWLHSAAHTADLFKFLARSDKLPAEGQADLLTGIARRLADTNGYVFVHGEDDRLAAAALSILGREDFDADAFDAFLRTLAGTADRTRRAGAFDPLLFAAQQNSKNFLRALYFQLDRVRELPEHLTPIQERIAETLRRM